MLRFMQNPAEGAMTAFTNSKQELVDSFKADSHDLAHRDHGAKGEVYTQTEDEVRDLGWHKSLVNMHGTFIEGVPNENLFAMIRRFNKDVFDVRAVPPRETTGLDLTEAGDEDHVSDKIMLNSQRVYLNMILVFADLGKHIARLRSWKETYRTAAFCAAYFGAWYLNLIIPLIIGTLLVIVGSEESRHILFPPAPLALVKLSNGGLQKPPAGQLGTVGTLTGAPEKALGEAREEEAASFVENTRHIIARVMGMDGSSENEGSIQSKVPKPIKNAMKSVKEAGSAPGHAKEDNGKAMTEEPMEKLLWEQVKPTVIDPVVKYVPTAIAEMLDNWERFANAISPTPPFSPISYLRIQGVLAPLFLISLLVPQHIVYKTATFAIGFAFFGEPVISKSLKSLNENIPKWKEVLEPKNNILYGIPTNNQLTITLLRIGEAHRSPIPPVPITKSTDGNNIPQVQINKLGLDASQQEITEAMEPSPMPKGHGEQTFSPDDTKAVEPSDDEKDKQPKHRHLSRVIGVFKSNTKAVVEAKLAVDNARASAGSKKVLDRIGTLPQKKNLIYAGPAEFKARFGGEKGWLYISSPTTSSASTTATPRESRLLFVADNSDGKIDLADESKIKWSIAVQDIRRLKREVAYTSKLLEKAADWSDETELLNSLGLVDEGGKEWQFTAVPERDELFNRLVSLGNQRWENM